MLLSAHLLNNVSDVNHFEVVSTLETVQGDTSDIYFRLTDASVDKSFDPPGRRYIPAVGSAVRVTITDIDEGTSIEVQATQPFADDRSIWKLAHAPQSGADLSALVGTYALKLRLTEGQKTKYAFVSQALTVRRASPEF